MGGGLQVSTKVFVGIAALLSTLISLSGGLTMYLDGLSVVELTVKEISAAELTATGRALNSTFGTAYETSLQYVDILQVGNMRHVPPGKISFDDIRDTFERDAFPRLRHSDLYGISLMIVPMTNTSSNSSGLVSITYWEPLSVNVTRGAPGSWYYVASAYVPSNWGKKVCVGDDVRDFSRHRCMSAYELDPETAERAVLLYEYPVPLINSLGSEGLAEWAPAQQNWEAEGAAFWRHPDVWKSKDGTPYHYGSYMQVLPQTPDHPFVPGPGYKIVVGTFITFDPWSDRLKAAGAEAVLVATFLGDGLHSQVLGTNTEHELTKHGCERGNAARGRNDCIRTLEFLTPTIQEACRKANSTEEGRFFRTSIAGSDNWVRRLVVHQAHPHDNMQTIHLIWIRPVSSVEDRVRRGLFTFLAFLGAIIIVDVVILLAEVRHIARPLEELEWSMEPIDRMDISEAQRRLSESSAGLHWLNLVEVQRLLQRFGDTLEALVSYKAFLPQSCLPTASEEDEHPDKNSVDTPPTATPQRELFRVLDVKRSPGVSRKSAPAISGHSNSPRLSTHPGVWDKSEVTSPTASRSMGANETRIQRGSENPLASGDSPRSAAPGSAPQSPMERSSSPNSFTSIRGLPDAGPGVQIAAPRTKAVALLAVNSCGFLKQCQQGGSTATATLIATQVARVARQVKLEKGNVDLISGDHSFASFDAVRRCSNHRMHAVRCAWSLRVSAGPETLQSTSAVCCGPTLCGDFGSTGMKRFMFVGGLYCALQVMDRIAAQRRVQVLLDSVVHQDVSETCPCKLVDRILYPKVQAKPMCIWSVVEFTEQTGVQGGHEWMYELWGSRNRFHQYNALLTQILKGQHGAAADELAQLLDTGRESSSPPDVVAALRDLKERLLQLPLGRPCVQLVHEVYLETVDRDETDP
eukprot:TRINITY_DN4413_c0_g2_i1.p1 TRINITY_DN4413_c0_g2~~TRINITY_DN4413_c0_g2_i1.p1  ORF type:complete len:918 (+),score=204.85 TRINITY_DN4413_c0_g2_i1:96-2849(+)